MADISDVRTLDMMFEWLEPTPEGFKVEIVAGNVFVSPHGTPTGRSLAMSWNSCVPGIRASG